MVRSEQKEVIKTGLPVRLLVFLVKFFPPPIVFAVSFLIAFFYWLGAFRQRSFIREFQKNVRNCGGDIKRINTFKTIFSFALSLVEKTKSWVYAEKNPVPVSFCNDDIQSLSKSLAEKKGAVLVMNHLGNMDLIRSLAVYGNANSSPITVTAIRELKATSAFDYTINSVNGNMLMHALDADNIGMETLELLQERIDSGGLVVIAGDRSSRSTPDRNVTLTFMKKNAVFPTGCYAVASLLKTDIYYMTAVREKTLMVHPKYNIFVKKCSVDLRCPKKLREERYAKCAEEFALFLENYAKMYPFQWYNFFTFWEGK